VTLRAKPPHAFGRLGRPDLGHQLQETDSHQNELVGTGDQEDDRACCENSLIVLKVAGLLTRCRRGEAGVKRMRVQGENGTCSPCRRFRRIKVGRQVRRPSQ